MTSDVYLSLRPPGSVSSFFAMNAPWSLRLALGVALLAAAFFSGVQHGKRSTAASPPASARNSPAAPAASPARSAGRAPADAVEPAASSAKANGSPPVILNRLASLRPSPNQPRSIRELLFQLEQLRAAGPAALPAIRDFLAVGTDADYDAPPATRPLRDGKVPLDFMVPPSLRLGLLEIVKNIGGPDAETILFQELTTTGRGVEAAYLAGALDELAPGKYRDPALAAARDLLAMPLTSRPTNSLDRSDREYLYQMLATAGDRSQVAQAQTHLLLPNGQVDRGALRYLQQSLGEQAVTVAQQAWADPRVPPPEKEPLARLALAYVGVSAEAEQLYRIAIDDPAMSDSARKNLIEDLNETGFADPRNLTAADLPLIERRLALIDRLAPRAKDATNAAAFAEARNDLVAMRARAARNTPPKK